MIRDAIPITAVKAELRGRCWKALRDAGAARFPTLRAHRAAGEPSWPPPAQ